MQRQAQQAVRALGKLLSLKHLAIGVGRQFYSDSNPGDEVDRVNELMDRLGAALPILEDITVLVQPPLYYRRVRHEDLFSTGVLDAPTSYDSHHRWFPFDILG